MGKKRNKFKSVRIDPKTVIFVRVDVSDEEARARYLAKIEYNHKRYDNWRIERRWQQ